MAVSNFHDAKQERYCALQFMRPGGLELQAKAHPDVRHLYVLTK